MTTAPAILPSATRSRFGLRLAFWVMLAVTLSQILALGGDHSWSWVPAQICLSVGLAVVLLGHSKRDGRLPWHPILIPVLLFGLLVSIQWIAHASIYPALTLTGLIQLSAGGAVLYLSFYAFQSGKNLRYLSVALWWFTGLLSMEAIIQYFEAGKKIFWLYDASYATPVGPFIYHNFYAGAMDLLIPVTLAAAFWPLSGRRPDLLGSIRRSIFPALALISVIISQSRGGFFTLVFEAVLALVLFWKYIRSSRSGLKRLALVGCVFVAFASLASWKPLVQRLTHLEFHDPSAIDRLAVAKTCVRIWRDHIWTGTGFATFPAVYPAYETFDNGLNWTHAHNEYAQALAETGLAGCVLILAFLLILLYSAWPRPAPALRPTDIYRRACAIALAGFLFHSYGDFLFHAPGLMLLFFLLTGVVLAIPRNSRAHRRHGRVHEEGNVPAGSLPSAVKRTLPLRQPSRP